MIYISCSFHARKHLEEKYPGATFVPTEGHLSVLAEGICKALHDVTAPQCGDNWRVISNGYYHSVVEIFD